MYIYIYIYIYIIYIYIYTRGMLKISRLKLYAQTEMHNK